MSTSGCPALAGIDRQYSGLGDVEYRLPVSAKIKMGEIAKLELTHP